MNDNNASGSGIRRTVVILAIIAVIVYLLFIAAGVFGYKDVA